MTAILPTFFQHNTWANLRLYDLCTQLSEAQLASCTEGTYGSIGRTLQHLAGGQENYLEALTGERFAAPLRPDDPFLGMIALRQRIQQSSAALEMAAEEFSADRLLRGTRRGENYEIAASIVLLQAINHATEHRAQVATILTQQGIEPPTIDAWAFNEARRGWEE